MANDSCIDPKEHLAALGVGSATVSILLMASGCCYTMGLQNVVPQAFGSGEFEIIGIYLNRMIILTLCIFAPLLIPLQFIENLFHLFISH